MSDSIDASARLSRLEADARAIFGGAIQRVMPDALVRRALERGPVAPPAGDGQALLLACGKAAVPMTSEFLKRAGFVPTRGMVTTPYERDAAWSSGGLEVMKSAHPVPDAASEAAAARALALARTARRSDRVIVLLSGGGSSLWSLPAPGLTLDDLRQTTTALLRRGANIREMNTVRKHLSAIKGGRLAAASAPATVETLIISDVVGDDPATIASGPTVPDPTTFREALGVLEERGGVPAFPHAVVEYLEDGVRGRRPETPKPGDPIFAGTSARIIGSNADALEGAADHARSLGYTVIVHREPVRGEASEAGRGLARMIISTHSDTPVCLIWGGETTVTVSGNGRGGRNQELALAAAVELAAAHDRPLVFLSGGTDGIDGPTDAAGACVSPRTLPRANSIGVHAEGFLRRNDAYAFFDKVGGLVVTGPTGTNVMDVQLALLAPAPVD